MKCERKKGEKKVNWCSEDCKILLRSTQSETCCTFSAALWEKDTYFKYVQATVNGNQDNR